MYFVRNTKADAPISRFGFCDFETVHTGDLEAMGTDVRVVGNTVHIFKDGEDTGERPTVGVKGGCMVVWDRPEGREKEVYDLDTPEDMVWAWYTERVERVYFHNMKFDMRFVLDWAYANGKKMKDGTVKVKRAKGEYFIVKGVMMGKQGILYQVKCSYVVGDDRHTLTVWDSARVYSSSLRSLAKDVGMEKGEEALTVGYGPEVREYCMQDCRILCKVVQEYLRICTELSHGNKPNGCMTAAGTALYFGNQFFYEQCIREFNAMDGRRQEAVWQKAESHNAKAAKNARVRQWDVGDALMDSYLPRIDTSANKEMKMVDGEWVWVCTEDDKGRSWIREAYKGATPLLDKSKRFDLGGRHMVRDVLIKDVNSMFPTQMAYARLPYGKPMDMTEEQMYDCLDGRLGSQYTWVMQVRMCAKVKKGHRATFLLKRGKEEDSFGEESKTLETMVMEDVHTISEPDWELVQRDYDVYDVEPVKGCMFRAKEGMFKDFIDHWYAKKAVSKGAERAFCKLMLNSYYGKFGTSPYREELEMDMKGGVLTSECVGGQTDMEMDLYLPVAIWTTAHARNLLSKGCNALGWEHVVYTDTDSWHIEGLTEEEVDIRLMSVGVGTTNALGDAKFEGWEGGNSYPYGLYVRNKGYMHLDEDMKVIDCKFGGANDFSGIDTLDDIVGKAVYSAKKKNWVLVAHRLTGYSVHGGVLLMDTAVDIVEDKYKVKTRGL